MEKLPLYLQIKQDIKNAIESGKQPEGSRIPSELELATQYGVSRNPTRQALRELELEGYITRTRRRGSFVAPPSHRAKQFSLSHGRVVAIVCPHVKSPHVRSIVEGFIHQAGEMGFHAMVYFMECTDKVQSELLTDIRQSGLAGVALWLTDELGQTLDTLTKFRKTGFPFVLFDRYVRERDWDFVVTDNEKMAHTLTTTLIERGHQRIGFFRSHYQNTANEDRFMGYQRALREKNIPYSEDLTTVLNPDDHAVRLEVDRVVANRSRPSAFLFTQGWIAIEAADELRRLGYALPEDIEFATVDDGEFALKPDVASLKACQRSYEMGRQTAELLMKRVEMPQAEPVHRYLDVNITVIEPVGTSEKVTA